MKKKINERITKIINYLFDDQGIDMILSTTETPDFVECVCDIGGDIITYRAYDKNGSISLYEK